MTRQLVGLVDDPPVGGGVARWSWWYNWEHPPQPEKWCEQQGMQESSYISRARINQQREQESYLGCTKNIASDLT